MAPHLRLDEIRIENVCCFDFRMMNEYMEEEHGLRKKKTPIEQLIEDRQSCLYSLMHSRVGTAVKEQNEHFLKEIDQELANLGVTQAEIAEYSKESQIQQKFDAWDADRNAMVQAWKRTTPARALWKLEVRQCSDTMTRWLPNPQMMPRRNTLIPTPVRFAIRLVRRSCAAAPDAKGCTFAAPNACVPHGRNTKKAVSR